MKSRGPALFLAAIILFNAAVFLLWAKLNETPPTWDECWHMMSGVYYLRIFNGVPTETEAYPILAQMLKRYPPVFYLASAAAQAVLGVGYENALYVNLAYLALMTLAVYKIGERIHSKKTGFYAALIAASFPAAQYYMRQFLIDYALAATTGLSIWALILSDKLSSGKYTIVFMVTFLAGLLTKGNYVIFIAGPLIVTLAYRLKEGAFVSGRIRSDAALAPVFLFMALSVRVFLIAYPVYASMDVSASVGNVAGPWNVSLGGLLDQIKSFADSVSILYVPLILLGLREALKKRGFEEFLILSWIAIPLMLIIPQVKSDSSFHNLPRHMLPALPAVALVAANGLLGLKNTRVEQLAVVVSAAIVLTVNLGLSLPDTQFGGVGVPLSPRFLRHPAREDWLVEGIVGDISRMSGGGGFSLQVIADMPYFNDVSFPYAAYILEVEVDRIIGPYGLPDDFDYVVVSDIDKPVTWRYNQFKSASDRFDSSRDSFELVGEYFLPNGSEAVLYRNLRLEAQEY